MITFDEVHKALNTIKLFLIRKLLTPDWRMINIEVI